MIMMRMQNAFLFAASSLFSKRTCSIFALSSGSLPSAIAIVRISGKESLICLKKLTKQEKIKPREMFYSKLYTITDEIIDRAMNVFFPGPSTFTGEDTVEIYVHGSRAVVDCLFSTLNSFKNVRPAKAGEFTKRAFFNSKMNLSDVESLSYLLTAQTQQQRRLALSSSGIGSAFKEINEKILELRTIIEATIDFSDDVHFDYSSFLQSVQSIISDLKLIEKRVSRGAFIMNGLRVTLIGRTNVGKSSLINRIAQREVAIVSKIEGTTRDSLDAYIEISSIPVILTDTAGIRMSNDPIESEGVKRALSRASGSDLVLLIIDASSKNIKTEINALLKDCDLTLDDRIIIVLNKSDLIEDQTKYSFKCEQIYTSCIGDGDINALIDALRRKILELCPSDECNALLSRTRQRILLTDTIKWLEMFESTEDLSIGAEILRKVQDCIGEISGVVVNEDILNNIFSSFCIGK